MKRPAETAKLSARHGTNVIEISPASSGMSVPRTIPQLRLSIARERAYRRELRADIKESERRERTLRGMRREIAGRNG